MFELDRLYSLDFNKVFCTVVKDYEDFFWKDPTGDTSDPEPLSCPRWGRRRVRSTLRHVFLGSSSDKDQRPPGRSTSTHLPVKSVLGSVRPLVGGNTCGDVVGGVGWTGGAEGGIDRR